MWLWVLLSDSTVWVWQVVGPLWFLNPYLWERERERVWDEISSMSAVSTVVVTHRVWLLEAWNAASPNWDMLDVYNTFHILKTYAKKNIKYLINISIFTHWKVNIMDISCEIKYVITITFTCCFFFFDVATGKFFLFMHIAHIILPLDSTAL